MTFTKNELIGMLDGDDLLAQRALAARRQAFEANPRAYSQSESEQIWMDSYRSWGKIHERFNLDPLRAWRCDPASGAVFYTGEDLE